MSVNDYDQLTRFFLFPSGGLGGVQLGPLDTAATVWLTVPAPGDYDDGEFVGIKIGRGTRGTQRKLQRHFVHQKSHLTRPGIESGPPQ
jgi:hypothetical protein